ncbi:MAG: TIGR00725 family protein [Deltaproteobacteria bacterium]|nr:MAG: TIGR00725 family protein [Deltaproteobacteria bacterium]
MTPRRPIIGVIGSGQCAGPIHKIALEVGQEIARRDAVLVCGGLGGVMEAAAEGAAREGGLTVGILPGPSIHHANPYIRIPIATDMGHARNVIIAHTADALVAVAGGSGTLSEIGHALKIGKPVIGLRTIPNLERVQYMNTAQEAVACAFEILGVSA